VPFLEELMVRFQSPRDTVLQDVLRRETRDRVQQAVGKLPPELRIVVVLRYTQGLPYDAIAGIVGCPEGTVASRLNRAHKILERRLNETSGRRLCLI
jgi:RNA polymerase sigma-70 factor (ECF subfamily)